MFRKKKLELRNKKQLYDYLDTQLIDDVLYTIDYDRRINSWIITVREWKKK